MLTEKHPLWRPRQDLGQLRFPIKEAAAPAIEAIKEQEVEGVEDQVPTAAAERLVEQRNVRDPALVLTSIAPRRSHCGIPHGAAS
jgi:hypothetical protein